MGIEKARRESANDVTANLKRLMNGRRLMDRAGDRLEVLRVEGEWINVAVPANNIEGMMCHRHARPARPVRENPAPNMASPSLSGPRCSSNASVFAPDRLIRARGSLLLRPCPERA